ncbi:MAG: L-threonylcarbamoyladenylate synthase [Rhodocyclaceae bacterium]|nr:L-threonylcarbamoyladenylate synthase [Rhodocyclaceae bacterium]
MSPDIEQAVHLLKAGELVAFPTDTVYGLGADAMNPAALAKIFAIKERPLDRPLAVLLPDVRFVTQWARDIPESFWNLAQQYWPGPLTIILKRAPGMDDILTAGRDTIGLRVPDHPVALALLNAFGHGMATTSANLSGHPSPTTAQAVRQELGSSIPLILDGDCPLGLESTILDLSGPEPTYLRLGSLRP